MSEEIIKFESEYLELDECPNCGAPNQEYIESKKEKCNCSFNIFKEKIVHYYKCNNCGFKYGIKE